MTARCCGDPSGPALISRASAVSIRISGMLHTLLIRGRSLPESNMPAYAFPRGGQRCGQMILGTIYPRRSLLAFLTTTRWSPTPPATRSAKPFPTVRRPRASARVTARPPKISAFDGVTTQLTEMDALVAYLQVLGRLTDAAYRDTAAPEEAPDPED